MSRQRDVKKRMIGISFLKNEKTAYILAARSSEHFLIAKSLCWFQIAQFSQKFQFFP